MPVQPVPRNHAAQRRDRELQPVIQPPHILLLGRLGRCVVAARVSIQKRFGLVDQRSIVANSAARPQAARIDLDQYYKK